MVIGDKKGMTLVEVLVSSGILALVIVSVVATVANISVFAGHIDAAYTATNLAKARMDYLKRFNFGSLPDEAPETDYAIDINNDGETDYLRTTTVTENHNGNSYLTKVKVSVDRVIDGEALNNPVEIDTLFAETE